jgi:DNA-binding Xre family transcriptional regulator
MKNKHSGSTFDSFLQEEGIKQDVEAVAIKRVLSWQFKKLMAEQHKTKVKMAREIQTSRSQLDRLLDPKKLSVTLGTLTKAAHVLGKEIVIQITDRQRPELHTGSLPEVTSMHPAVGWFYSLPALVGFYHAKGSTPYEVDGCPFWNDRLLNRSR